MFFIWLTLIVIVIVCYFQTITHLWVKYLTRDSQLFLGWSAIYWSVIIWPVFKNCKLVSYLQGWSDNIWSVFFNWKVALPGVAIVNYKKGGSSSFNDERLSPADVDRCSSSPLGSMWCSSSERAEIDVLRSAKSSAEGADEELVGKKSSISVGHSLMKLFYQNILNLS